MLDFLDGLISHYVLDDGNLVVAHAGLKEAYHGRASGRVRSFALYGDTTGETDEYGLPVRYPWAHEYRGQAMVVYGHTPVPEAEWFNRTICIDTGCVFGGRMPVTRLLPVAWYATPNIHHVTVDDFRALVKARGIVVEECWFLSGDQRTGSGFANLFAEHAVFLLRKDR